jgi:hypothetical protein
MQALLEPIWAKVIAYYLMIGWATQLPGGLFRRYPALWLVRRALKRHGPQALLGIPLIWIPFTILLWPVPFLRAGVSRAAAMAGLIGLVGATLLVFWASSWWGAALVVALAGLIPTLSLRPR